MRAQFLTRSMRAQFLTRSMRAQFLTRSDARAIFDAQQCARNFGRAVMRAQFSTRSDARAIFDAQQNFSITNEHVTIRKCKNVDQHLTVIERAWQSSKIYPNSMSVETRPMNQSSLLLEELDYILEIMKLQVLTISDFHCKKNVTMINKVLIFHAAILCLVSILDA